MQDLQNPASNKKTSDGIFILAYMAYCFLMTIMPVFLLTLFLNIRRPFLLISDICYNSKIGFCEDYMKILQSVDYYRSLQINNIISTTYLILFIVLILSVISLIYSIKEIQPKMKESLIGLSALFVSILAINYNFGLVDFEWENESHNFIFRDNVIFWFKYYVLHVSMIALWGLFLTFPFYYKLKMASQASAAH